MRATYDRGGGGALAFGQTQAGDPCASPHTSGVKVPPTVPFNLSFATGYIFTLRTYLKKKKKVQSQKRGSPSLGPRPNGRMYDAFERERVDKRVPRRTQPGCSIIICKCCFTSFDSCSKKGGARHDRKRHRSS